MKKLQRNININKAARIHAASMDDSEMVENFRTFFVTLFVFSIFVI